MCGSTDCGWRDAFEQVYQGRSPGRIVQGDALQVLSDLPAGSVDLIFGDLPFNLGKDYVRFGLRPPDMPDDDLPMAQYWELCRAWVRESARVLADHGSLYVMTAAQHLGFMLAILDELAHWQDTIVWPNTSMPRRDRFTPAWQPILWYTKTERYIYHHDADGGPTRAALPYGREPGGHTMTNLWSDISPINGGCMAPQEAILMPGSKRKAHAAQMPLGLPRRAILACTEPGMLVADFWVGSGTTAVAAADAGRRFFAADVDPRCVALSEARLQGDPGAAIDGYGDL